ncbi:MAG: glycosyltransferase family 2 protein, partial [Deltaproteobacteria bacterium]
MPAMPLCSILIATQNCATKVRASLQSVAAQSYRNLEICIIDNGSVDDTPALVAQFCDSYPRAKLQLRKRRAWGEIFNELQQQAVGDYIAHLEPGDTFLPRKLAVQIEALVRQPRLGAVATHIAYTDVNHCVQMGPTPIYNTVLDADEAVRIAGQV